MASKFESNLIHKRNLPPYVNLPKVDDENDTLELDTSPDTPPREAHGFQKEPRKDLLKLFVNLLVVFGFIVANYLYKITDTMCPYNDENSCAQNFIFPNLFKWAIQLSIAAFIWVLVIYAGLMNKIYRIYALIAVVNIVYLVLFYHPVINKREYGQAFSTFLLLLLGFVTGMVVFFSLLVFCARKCWPVAALTVFSIFSFCLLFYLFKVKGSCDHWKEGLANDRIRDLEGLCEVNKLEDSCIYEITSGWFDFTSSQKCSDERGNIEVFKKYYPDAPIIGLPRTEKFTEEERMPRIMPIQTPVLNYTIGLKSFDDPAAKDLEIFIDRRDINNPKLVIDVKKNQTLINEREKIKHEGLAKNVIVIFVDALSRANSMRKLKKTMSWFEKHMNDQSPDADAFQFFRYHSIAPVTYPNLFEAYYGKHPDVGTIHSTKSSTSEAQSSSSTRILESPDLSAGSSPDTRLRTFVQTYKEMGYITAHSTDFCYTTPFETPINGTVRDTPYDHESTAFACDPHYHNPESPYQLSHGPYSAYRRCLYGTDTFNYAFEYGNQFWRKYKDQKKLLYFDLLDAHDGVGEMVKYADGALEEFLENLRKESLLEDTAVILYADHGLHLAGIYYFLGGQQVVAEAYLPALYAVLPKKITEKYGVNIKANEQKIVSPREIHHLFKALAEGEGSKSIEASLLGKVATKRTCHDIGVLDEACVCNYNS